MSVDAARRFAHARAMAERKRYDDREAAHIFANARERSGPRKDVLLELLKELSKCAEGRGYHVTDRHDGQELGIAYGPTTPLAWLRCEGRKIEIASTERDDWKPIKLSFDPVGDRVVGTKPDTFLNPVPGEPKAQPRSALAVLAEAVVKKLNDQST